MAKPLPWTEILEPDELNFVRRFLLASGSLKEMAEEYGVSYPTIRQRLDGMIEKIRRSTKDKPMSELRRTVRQLVEDGTLDLPEARKLLSAAAKDIANAKEGSDS